MLSCDDCLGFCELTPEEIAAIARHEHLPEIVALELGAHLCTTPEGKETLKRMILDDIEDAREQGDMKAATRLELALRHFVETCPPSAPVRQIEGFRERRISGSS